MPSITICTFLTLTNSFKLFDQNLALTDGKPGRTTEMLAMAIRNAYGTSPKSHGTAQAMAVVFFIIVALLALTSFGPRTAGRCSNDSALFMNRLPEPAAAAG